MGTIDQRKHPRLTVEVFADWGWGPECEYYDRVTSLSLSGCFLATRRELKAGQEIYIKLKNEMAGVINLKGSVRYQLRVMEGSPPTGAGLEFLNLSSEIASRLQKLLEGYR
jgi:PilZ domain